jgi:hypothetical protein
MHVSEMQIPMRDAYDRHRQADMVELLSSNIQTQVSERNSKGSHLMKKQQRKNDKPFIIEKTLRERERERESYKICEVMPRLYVNSEYKFNHRTEL